MLRRGAASWFVATLVTSSACVRTGAFECASQDDCVDAGVNGRCEANGFCSFPDASCPSEQRYGDHAGNGLGGQCVPPMDDTSTGLPQADDDASDASTSSPTTATTVTSSESDTFPLTDGTESSGVIASTGPDSAETTTIDPSDSSGESSTTGPIAPECPTFADDFEDGAFDPSWAFMDADYVSEAGGALVFEVTAALDQVFPGVLLHEQDLASGEVRIHVGQAPGPDLAERLYLAVAVDPVFSDVLYIMIEGNLLRMEREHGPRWTYYLDLPYDPREHEWLQIRGEGDSVHFETSSDGATFDTQFTTEAPFPLLGTTVVVAATNYAITPADSFLSIEDFEICNGD